MAVKVGVEFDPVVTKKVDAALARIRSQAKGVNFGDGARSLDKLSRPLGKITGQATEFKKSLDASNARVLAFGASVAVINKLSQAFGALVSNTVKVEATFAKINVILGGTDKQLRQFGNGIFDVARKTATSFDQVAEGALELARQGLSVEESLSRVETALKLVRVAGIDSQQAVAGLTAAIKGFEGAGLTVADIADKLAEVDTKFAVSTEDLINGLERASASARVAGVSFDELLGLITTVQERTQRGGAVIGNAFKTIFARLGRTDTLSALQDLGIAVLDAEGNTRSAVPLFRDLAAQLDELGLKSEAAGEIIQKVAGVRQRDILISLVEDLNQEQSQFANALEKSAGAAGKLDQKNSSLNDTLEALINNLIVGGQQLSSVLGEVGFADAAKDILRLFSSAVTGITDLLQGDSVGSKFAKGIVSGIGSVLTGPGLALIGAIFTKLFIDLAKFGATSLRQILGINKAAEQQKTLQQSVLQTLLQNENIQREILALEGNKVAQEQLLLRIYNDQAAALARIQKTAATVTPGLFAGGFRGGERGITRRGAGGYVAAEAGDVSRGVGGATPGSKVVSIPNFAFGRGKRGTMVANTSEYYIPNYSSGGDAIFNKDMVRTMGLPSGARKINASGGFIPNFATATSAFQDFMRSKGITPRQLRSTNYDSAYTKGRYREEFDSLSPLEQRNITKSAQQQAQLKRKKGADAKTEFGIMYSDVIGGTPATNLLTPAKNSIRAIPIDTQPPNKLYSDLRESMIKSAVSFAQTLGFQPDIIQDNKFKKAADRSLNPGAVEGAFGTVFEAAFQGALGIPQKSNAIFDLPSPTAINQLISKGKAGGIIERVGGTSGPLVGLQAVDIKNALNLDNIKSIDNKIKNRGAYGYIPNFAGGLEDAIAREEEAGIPINQIRVNQSGKLRNAQNPRGLAVTNTKDEPTGRIPSFAKEDGLGRGGDALTTIFAAQAIGGLVSGFTEAESAIGKFVNGLSNAVTIFASLTLLDGPLRSFSSKLVDLGSMASLTGRTQSVIGASGAVGEFAAQSRVGKAASAIGGALPGIGVGVAIAASVAPLILELTKTKSGFEELNEELSRVDLSSLTELGGLENFQNVIQQQIEERETVAKTKGAAAAEGVTLKGESLKEVSAERAENLLKDAGFSGRALEDLGPIVSRALASEISEEDILSGVVSFSRGGARSGQRSARADQDQLLENIDAGLQGRIETLRAQQKAEDATPAFTGVRREAAAQQVRSFFGNRGAAIDTSAAESARDANLELLKATTEESKNTIRFEQAKAKLISETAKQRNDALQTLSLEAIASEELSGIEQEKLNNIITSIDKNTTSVQLAEKLKTELGLQDDAAQKIADSATKINKEINLQSSTATRILKIENETAEATAKRADKLQQIQNTLTKQLNLSRQEAQENQFAFDNASKMLELESKAGPISPNRKRELEYNKELARLKLESTQATNALSDAEDKRDALQNTANRTSAQEVELNNLNETVRLLKLQTPIIQENIEKEKELARIRRDQSGFERGVEALDQKILNFGDELGEAIPGRFSNNLGQALTDAVSGAKDLDTALSDAGRNFLGFIRDAFLQQAADSFTTSLMGGKEGGGSIFGGISDLFGGSTAAAAADPNDVFKESFKAEGELVNSGTPAAAAAEKSSGGGIGGFFSNLFGGGKKSAALGSSPSTPMYVSDVGNTVAGQSKDPATKAVEELTGGAGDGGEQGFFSKMKDSFSNIFTELKSGFGDLFGGLKDTLGGAFKSLFGGGQGGGGGFFGNILGSIGGMFTGQGGGFSLGGLFGFQRGGIVGFANGGPVGSTDTVPAMLSPGEFVVRRSAVDKYGADFLSSLNRGLLPMQGFQNGGSVSPVASETGTGGGVGQVNNTSDFTFNIDQGGEVNQQGGEDASRQQRDFAARVKEAVTTVVQEESRTGGTLNYLYSS